MRSGSTGAGGAQGALGSLQAGCLCLAGSVLHSCPHPWVPRRQCCALLIRVAKLSALLTQSQKQNEDYDKTVKALRETMETLVRDPLFWQGVGSGPVGSCPLWTESAGYQLNVP